MLKEFGFLDNDFHFHFRVETQRFTQIELMGNGLKQIYNINTGCLLMSLGKYKVPTLVRKQPVSLKWGYILPIPSHFDI